MKVVKEGKGWSKKVTCRGCGAVLEFDETDLKHTVTDTDLRSQYEDEEIEGTFSINCPICGTDYKVKDVPDPIKIRVKTR